MGRISRLFSGFRGAPAAPPEEPAPTGDRWVVAGLGNPGEQYRRSRHNTGFMAAGRLAARYSVELNRRKFSGLYAEARIAGAPTIIVIPQTFYNRSGDCLSPLLGYYKVPPERLIVIHDEMDLPLPQLRLKRGGSDAGNRGVRSVAASLGTPEFIRIRIGVGRPNLSGDAIEHVLQPFSADEVRGIQATLDRVADSVERIIADGLERAMSLYNQRA